MKVNWIEKPVHGHEDDEAQTVRVPQCPRCLNEVHYKFGCPYCGVALEYDEECESE